MHICVDVKATAGLDVHMEKLTKHSDPDGDKKGDIPLGNPTLPVTTYVMATAGLSSSHMWELTKPYAKHTTGLGIPESRDFRLPDF